MKRLIVAPAPNALANFEHPELAFCLAEEGYQPTYASDEVWVLVGKDEKGMYYRTTDHVRGLVSQKVPALPGGAVESLADVARFFE